jgi:hypothetical protein
MVSVCPAITINLNIQPTLFLLFVNIFGRYTSLYRTCMVCTKTDLLFICLYSLAILLHFCCGFYNKSLLHVQTEILHIFYEKFRQLWVQHMLKRRTNRWGYSSVHVAFMSLIFILGDVFCYRLQQGHRCLFNSHLLTTEDSRVLHSLHSKVRISNMC